MELTEVKKMRKKQILMINGFTFTSLVVYFIVIQFFQVTMSHLLFVLAIIIFSQSFYMYFRRNQTKSFFPSFEQVAIYEKEKMGNEYLKQKKMGFILNFLLSGILIWQSFMIAPNSADAVYSYDFGFIILFILLMLVMINIGLYFRIRKIDRSDSTTDFKGYTWKTILIGVVFGLIIGCVLIVSIFIYILKII